jgi:hypothetical protein
VGKPEGKSTTKTDISRMIIIWIGMDWTELAKDRGPVEGSFQH